MRAGIVRFFVSSTSSRLSYNGANNPDGSAPRCVSGVTGTWFCHPVSYYIPRWSLLYLGLYVMVFKECMSVLRKRRSRPGNHLVGTAISLFILTTAVRFSLTLSFTFLMGTSPAPCHWHPTECTGFHLTHGRATLSIHILQHIRQLDRHSQECSLCRRHTGVRRIHCTFLLSASSSKSQ